MANEGFFNIPTDKYKTTYSGPSQQAFQQFPGQQKQYYNQARGDIGKGYDTAITDIGKTYQSALEPALQQNMNNLASRGMLNSSLAGDTMAETARSVGQNILGQQSQLQLGKQQQLAGLTQREGLGMYHQPQLLTNLLSQGRFSEESDNRKNT